MIKVVQRDVACALDEDVGSGDLTAHLIPANQQAQATILSRESAIVCGLAWAEHCFKSIDSTLEIDWLVNEGHYIVPNQPLCRISGNARAMLTAERSALNFLQALSATATLTRKYTDAIIGSHARILDTRKTIPGLRRAQKYAVLTGGGLNHRIGLDDGILIKENHIAAAGGIAPALKAAAAIDCDVSIEIEVENMHELEQAIEAGAAMILLDNFSTSAMAEAVRINQGRAILEASGGITLENVRAIALTGVDRISVGSLTKNIQAIDLSMRFTSS